jgi:hypothetical protein
VPGVWQSLEPLRARRFIPLTAPRAEAQSRARSCSKHWPSITEPMTRRPSRSSVIQACAARGSHHPHGFPIGDHALPASRAACRCKFVQVLAALLTVVVAPSSIPLDMERLSKFPCLARSMHRSIQRGSPMASPSVGVPIAVQMTRMPPMPKALFSDRDTLSRRHETADTFRRAGSHPR